MNDIIPNEYDGPRRPVKKTASRLFSLDFANSNNPEVLDNGIRETMRGMNLSTIAVSRALYRISASGYYIELGYRSMGDYITKLVEETGYSRAIFYRWIGTGEITVKYHNELEKVDFSDDDGPTKLVYIPQALENHPKKEVFKNAKEMLTREFEAYARGKKFYPVVAYKNLTIKRGQIYAGGEPVINPAASLSPEDRRYIENLLTEAIRAKADKQYLRGYIFYDEKEANKFDKVYNRELKALRAGS
jgi:hypothetical protein